MSKLFIEDSSLTAIGNAIRAKTGETGLLSVPSGMVEAINNISAGSGGTPAVIQPLTITANGTYAAPSGVDGYSPVIVNVPTNTVSPDNDVKSLVRKTITTYSDDEVEVIGDYTFQECEYLTSVDIPNVKLIEEYAFKKCYSLVGINAPLVEEIRTSAFSNCGVGEYPILNVVFPKLTTLGSYAFAWSNNLKSIDLPLLTETSNYAFRDCEYLESVNMPLLEIIADNTFYNCDILENINFPKVTTIGSYAFYKSGLTTADFPLVGTIGNSAFRDCGKLESVSFEKATVIEPYAFYNCGFIEEFNFPLVQEIGEYAFAEGNVSSVTTSVNFPTVDVIHNSAFDGGNNIAYFSFPNATRIEDRVFSNNTLFYINAQNVNYIGEEAFYNCNHISDFNFPLCNEVYKKAFNHCDGLERVFLSSAQLMGNSIFTDSGVETVYINNTTDIPNYTFQRCSKLETVYAGNAKTIGEMAFFKCSSLKSINVSSAEIIKFNAFSECTSLESINLPKASSIAVGAFNDSTSLNAVILRNIESICNISDYTIFDNTPIGDGIGYIYVPFLLLEEYQNATNWTVFRGQFRALEDYTVDGTTTGALDETKI